LNGPPDPQENDAELLDFEAGAEGEDDEDGEDDDDEEDEDAGRKKAGKGKGKPAEAAAGKRPQKRGAAASGRGGAGGKKAEEELDEEDENALTVASVTRWAVAAHGGAASAARNLLRAFRSACHYGEPAADGDDAAAARALAIGSASVFNHVMLVTLREMDAILKGRIAGASAAAAATAAAAAPSGAASAPAPTLRIDAESSRWKKNVHLVKSYVGNALHVLVQMTDPAMLRFTLRRLAPSLPLLAPLPALQRRAINAAVALLGHDDGALRLQAALFVREAAVTLPAPALDVCLRGVYRTFASRAKFSTPAARPVTAFLAATCVELYGLQLDASYTRAFGYIRQVRAGRGGVWVAGPRSLFNAC